MLAEFNRVPGYQSIIYENSLIGTLSTDNRLVYAIEDLGIPAAPNMMQALNQPQQVNLKSCVLQNVLSAFDVNSGKYVWKLGKWSFVSNRPDTEDEKDHPFENSHFLSVPIYVGGKLFVLNEKNYGLNGEAELRLVCVDPDPIKVKDGRPHVVPTATGALWQDIGTIAQQSAHHA